MFEASLLSLFWEAFELADYRECSDGALAVRLQPCAHIPPCCSGCGQRTIPIHDVTRRRVRERDLFDRRVYLAVPVRRVRCRHCGVRTEALPWLAGRRRLTVAMVHHIEALAAQWPVSQVATLLGVHWHTVKAIDKARLARELPEPDRAALRRLLIDEFALHRGHRYATVVACAQTRAVLWIGEGRSREALRPFFTWLGAHCGHIEAV